MKKLRRKGLLLLSLLTRKRAFNSPLYIDLDITERCNLQCKGCRYHSPLLPASAASPPPRDLDFEVILRIFRDLQTMRTEEVILLGSGEPTLHKRFVDIVRAGKACQFKLTVLTNGTLLNEGLAEELVAAGLDQLKVSLWAANAEDCARIHSGSPLLFDRIVQGIGHVQKTKKKLGKHRPAVIIHCPVFQDKAGQVAEMVERAIDCGADGLSFAPVHQSFAEAGPLLLDSGQLSRVSARLESLAVRLKRAGLTHNFADLDTRLRFGPAPWEKMPCYIGFYHAKIRTNGKVYPCCRCNIEMGDVHDSSFRAIWNAGAYQSFRRQALAACGRNPFPDECNCRYCSSIPNNYRVFRVDRFIAPFTRLLRRENIA